LQIALIISNLGRESECGLDGKNLIPISNAAIPGNILIAKSQCQDAIDNIAPANVGPAAADTAITIAFRAKPSPPNKLDG